MTSPVHLAVRVVLVIPVRISLIKPNYTIARSVSPSIFRAYDIRGFVDENLTPDIIYTIALAIGSKAKNLGEHTIIVARDGRLSSPALSAALIQGLLDTGCNVLDIGTVPTPVLYFAAHVLPFHSGVVLTGSHNPENYNGLKIVLAGQTLAEDNIQKLYQRIVKQDFICGQGQLSHKAMVANYIQDICQRIKLKRSLKVVIDCGHGVAATVAPQLFTALGCEVVELYCHMDGRFPNHHPDPSVAENLADLQQTVIGTQADLGLAFDGDADRLGVVTDKGEIIWPDRQLMLYACDILTRHAGATIVFDVKCSASLAKVITRHGGKALMCQTGHSLIKARMREVNALLAGELSGHIFFKENWYGFDDAMYTASRLLEILCQQQGSISDLFEKIPDNINTPELKAPIAEEKKFSFMQQLQQQGDFTGGEVITIDGLRVEYPDGWGLVRASNTTPCLVLRFEAETETALARIQSLFKEQLLRIDRALAIPF